MSELKSIYAYTQTEGYAYYPGYVNYSQHDNGVMILTVRGTNQEQGQEIELPLSRFWDMVAAVGSFHLPADVEFVPSIFVDELSRKVAELESALAAEQEARKKAEEELQRMIGRSAFKAGYSYAEKEYKQRAEAAEARIKASSEQDIAVTVTMQNGYVFDTELNAVVFPVNLADGDYSFYAQPPIPPDVAELQRQLEEARKVPEGWQLMPKEMTYEIAHAMHDIKEQPAAGYWERVYNAAIAAAPTTDQPKE